MENRIQSREEIKRKEKVVNEGGSDLPLGLIVDDIVKHEFPVFVEERRFETHHLVHQDAVTPPVHRCSVLLTLQQLRCDILSLKKTKSQCIGK